MKTNNKIKFEYISYDTIKLEGLIETGAKISLFKGIRDVKFKEIHSYDERAIIECLMNNQSANVKILCKLFEDLWCPKIFYEKRNPFSNKPGDFDLIVYNKKQIQNVFACECKRVKISIDINDKEKINKINDIKHGIRQANSLYSLGFFKVLLIIIVTTDSKLSKRPIFKAAKDDHVSKIIKIISGQKLNSNIGVMFIDIIQPEFESLDKRAELGVGMLRGAVSQTQNVKITNWIKIQK